MRIAIIAPEAIPVPPRLGGSVEICILSIARELAKRHHVTVYSRTHPAYRRREQEGMLTFVRVPSGRPSLYISNVLKVMHGQTYDWIQVDNRPLFVPAVKQSFPETKVSLFLHSLTFVSAPRISREKAGVCLQKADMIIANSDSLKQELLERFPASGPKINRVHLGVDTGRFRPPSEEERGLLRRSHKLSGSYSVLFAGRIIPRKGIPVLMKAIQIVRKETPKVRLVIAGGNGPKTYRTKLRRLAARLRIPVTDLGYVPHARMHRVYRMADCFVCPSQKHEAFGLVNAEAMSTELPVIASDIGGIGEVIHDGKNGVLVKNFRDPSAFARAIRFLIHHPEDAERMGKQGRKDIIEHLSWRHTAEKLEELYR